MEPILNSPAGITLLAAVIALAVYLRQVSINAQDGIESILINKNPLLWPQSEKHTKDKTKLLTDIRYNIEWVTPLIFGLSVVISLRLVLYAVPDWILARASLFYFLTLYDLVLMSFVALLIVIMFGMHQTLKSREKEIRKAMEAWLKRNSTEASHLIPSSPAAAAPMDQLAK